MLTRGLCIGCCKLNTCNGSYINFWWSPRCATRVLNKTPKHSKSFKEQNINIQKVIQFSRQFFRILYRRNSNFNFSYDLHEIWIFQTFIHGINKSIKFCFYTFVKTPEINRDSFFYWRMKLLQSKYIIIRGSGDFCHYLVLFNLYCKIKAARTRRKEFDRSHLLLLTLKCMDSFFVVFRDIT